MAGKLFSLTDADVYYGQAQALHQLSFDVDPHEVVGLLGRNGVGKTTALKVMCGLLPLRSGCRTVNSEDLSGAGPERLNRAGIALVPDNRQVFPALNVRENLEMATVVPRDGEWNVDRVIELFPRLGERWHASGRALSGGEQQMVAIARAMLCNPRLLLLDEPTEGLAPLIVQDLIKAFREIAASGVSIVLVEQNLKVPRTIATRFCVMDNGRIVWEGDAEALERDREMVEKRIAI